MVRLHKAKPPNLLKGEALRAISTEGKVPFPHSSRFAKGSPRRIGAISRKSYEGSYIRIVSKC